MTEATSQEPYTLWEYKEVVYEAIGYGQMKIPTSREWLPAIIYRPLGKVGQNCIREVGDFEFKFKRIK